MMSQPRILFSGDVLGRLDQLYKRVASVNKANGPFDALICVGQFFPVDEANVAEVRSYLDGSKSVPLPTYFTGYYGERAFELLASARAKAEDLGVQSEPVEVCANLFWLKGSGIFTLNGLRIAYLGGRADAKAYEDAKLASQAGALHMDDVDALRALLDDKQVVDVFITNDWPSEVMNGSVTESQPPGCDKVAGNPVMSGLAMELKPRYHIAGTQGIFYTREPYANEDVSHVTRFVALGTVGNDKKQKYLHALSPTPASNLSPEELAVRPPNTTHCPYSELLTGKASRKRPLPEVDSTSNNEGQYWRFDTSGDAKRQKLVEGPCFEFIAKGACSRGEKCKFRHEFDDGTPIPKKACYDLITKGSCERGSECKFIHSFEEKVTAVGIGDIPPGVCFNFVNKGSCERGDSCRFSHAYERSVPSCWFCLVSPNVEKHLLVSIGDHCYCALAKGPLTDKHMLIIPIDHTPSAVLVPREAEQEFQVYKDALRACFDAQGHATIIFERYIHLRAGTHAHIQVVPVPQAAGAAAREAFEAAAANLGFSFITLPKGNNSNELRRLLDGVNYFIVELPDRTVLAHPCAAGERMPMQFGREVIAGLLGTPDKSDWKACKLTEGEETELVEEFKRQFEAYDPMRN